MQQNFPPLKASYTFLQTNRSDTLGSLWATQGIDLQTDLASMRVATRLMIAENTAASAGLNGTPVAFEYADFNLWAICGTNIYRQGGAPNAAWTQDASAGVPTNFSANSDMEVFNGQLWAASDNELYKKAMNGGGTGAWTAVTSLSSTLHELINFPLFNRLYYQNANGEIDSIDKNGVIATAGNDYSIALGSGNQISCMKANSNYIWVGISANSNIQGSVATIVQWDGISPVATQVFQLKSRWCLALTVFEDIVYAMDGNGVLNKFTGYSFQEIGRLPFTPQQPVGNFISFNGMMGTRNSTILAMVNNTSGDNTTTQENIPAGVWEWSKDYGFTQKNLVTLLTNAAPTSITDYGQNHINTAGAIFDVSAISPFTAGRNGSIIVGATYYTDATTTTNGIFFDDSNDTIQKKGYFVTSWFNSQAVEDKWNRLWAVYTRLLGATDSIVFKFQLYEHIPLIATITWVNTTSFTTTTDPTAYWTTGIGGEVEVLQGTGSGSCAHITSIVNNSGTYTVTLDETIIGVTTGTAKVRFQHWEKLSPDITGQVTSWAQMAINRNNPRIRIKCCMTFTAQNELTKFALFSNNDITVTA